MITHDIKSISTLKKNVLTVCLSESTGTNIMLSLQTAEHIAKTSGMGNVLYLNTVQTTRQLFASIRTHVDPEFSESSDDQRVTYESSPIGLLLDEKENFEAHITGRGITYVIINSWEFASRDYRRKADLIFLLNGWMEKFGITILVFAEKMKNAPESQRIQRGMGIGKLAAIAHEVKVIREGKSDVCGPKSEVTEEPKEREWQHMQHGPILATYEVLHGKQKELEGESWTDTCWRIHDLAKAEGLIGENGWLKWEIRHIRKDRYVLTSEDRALLKQFKEDEDAARDEIGITEENQNSEAGPEPGEYIENHFEDEDPEIDDDEFEEYDEVALEVEEEPEDGAECNIIGLAEGTAAFATKA